MAVAGHRTSPKVRPVPRLGRPRCSSANGGPGRCLLKGPVGPDDAVRAVDAGVDGIHLSNHGGRQLDGTVATIDLVRPVRDAVGDRAVIVMDSGVRHGADIAVALARGADMCMIGRPYLYGLAAAGPAGVRRAIDLLVEQFRRTLQLLGGGFGGRAAPARRPAGGRAETRRARLAPRWKSWPREWPSRPPTMAPGPTPAGLRGAPSSREGPAGSGYACAEYLASRGDQVWVLGSSTAAWRGPGERPPGRRLGLRRVCRRARLTRQWTPPATEMGGIDGVFVNAGIDGQGLPAAQLDVDHFRRVMDVNVIGAFLVARGCAPGVAAAIRHRASTLR